MGREKYTGLQPVIERVGVLVRVFAGALLTELIQCHKREYY